ncbi:MAG: START-like domain-containing protein [Prevotella sp.]
MEKRKVTIEYPLETKSPSIIWQLISTAEGLQKWIADYVSESDGKMTFTWGEAWTEQDTKTSQLIAREKNSRIRMKWEHDSNDASFWEMRIDKSELAGHLTLIITDFAEDGDKDYLHDLWHDNLRRLHLISGL